MSIVLFREFVNNLKWIADIHTIACGLLSDIRTKLVNDLVVILEVLETALILEILSNIHTLFGNNGHSLHPILNLTQNNHATLDSLPGQLSGGQKQRVAIARALYYKPRLMLCDEPTGNLDTNTGSQIISLFESLNQEDGLTVLAVTHEGFLFGSATHTMRLEDGRPVEGDEA